MNELRFTYLSFRQQQPHLFLSYWRQVRKAAVASRCKASCPLTIKSPPPPPPSRICSLAAKSLGNLWSNLIRSDRLDYKSSLSSSSPLVQGSGKKCTTQINCGKSRVESHLPLSVLLLAIHLHHVQPLGNETSAVIGSEKISSSVSQCIIISICVLSVHVLSSSAHDMFICNFGAKLCCCGGQTEQKWV